MAEKEETVRTTITLPKELDSKVEILSKIQNTSKNSAIVNLIEMSVDAQINLWKMMKDPNLMSNLVSAINTIGNDEQKEAMNRIADIMQSKDLTDRTALKVLDKSIDLIEKNKK